MPTASTQTQRGTTTIPLTIENMNQVFLRDIENMRVHRTNQTRFNSDCDSVVMHWGQLVSLYSVLAYQLTQQNNQGIQVATGYQGNLTTGNILASDTPVTTPPTPTKTSKKRTMSPEARKAIGDAQRKRHRLLKRGQGQGKTKAAGSTR